MGLYMRDFAKILIIDDSATSRLHMAQILQKANYQVITASSGYEGLMKMQQEPPHCLMLDVVLPDISGFEVCRKVRASDSLHLVPIVLVSSKDTPTDRYWGMRQGATRYLTKPFTEDVLLQTAREVVPIYVHPAVMRGQRQQMSTNTPQVQIVQDQLPLMKLIPRRVESSDVLWTNRPNASLISDREARFLYMAIDGRRTVERLCMATQMSQEDVSRALRVLLSLQRIQLYEPGGRVVDSSHIFNKR
jgi:CheY-like chemotaxis protein